MTKRRTTKPVAPAMPSVFAAYDALSASGALDCRETSAPKKEESYAEKYPNDRWDLFEALPKFRAWACDPFVHTNGSRYRFAVVDRAPYSGLGWVCLVYTVPLRGDLPKVTDESGGAFYDGADPSPFGAALVFVKLVGGAKASEALPGMVVPWYCQAAVDHGHPATELPKEAPAAGEATEAQGTAADAPAGQDGETVASLQLEERAEMAPTVRISWSVASGYSRGGELHVVVSERVKLGRWAREPGQALCKPRGMRLKAATGAPSCKGCLGEAEKRNITL